jgi:hypothetical protein
LPSGWCRRGLHLRAHWLLRDLPGFFAGGLIAEAVMRVIGLKRGTGILVIVLGGILAGTLIGFGLDFWLTWSEFASLDRRRKLLRGSRRARSSSTHSSGQRLPRARPVRALTAVCDNPRRHGTTP